MLTDNRLTTKAVVDSIGIYLTYKEEQKVQTIETVIEKEVNVIKWWQKALMWMGLATIAYAFFRLFILISQNQY